VSISVLVRSDRQSLRCDAGAGSACGVLVSVTFVAPVVSGVLGGRNVSV